LRSILCALLFALAVTPSHIAAQTAKTPTRKSATTPAKSTPTPVVCSCSPPVVQHIFRPYIAIENLTDAQIGANGTTFTDAFPMQVWRDDAGREREEKLRTLPDGTQYRDDSVYDPIEQVRMSWSVGKPNTPNIVTVYPFPSRETAQPTPRPAPANPQPDRRYFPHRTEALPPQTIAGLYAEGTLTTSATPAGYQGNDHDLISTTETWTSPDAGIQLRNIVNDPHFKSTADTSSIQFVPPDPSVFKAPEGYEVKYASPKPAPAAASACNCTTPTVTPQRVKPYSAKQTSTHIQTLEDGTTITTVTTSQMWRDADGRLRNETLSTGSDGALGHSVSIYDPVKHVRMNWIVDNPNVPKAVNVYRIAQPVSRPVALPPVNPQPAPHRYYPSISESLPPQTIAGIYVGGNRNTRTIPAGYEGNDRDITTTQERWYSPDLGITLRFISDDPRNGKTTTEVTDLQQTAPDPALFEIPQGYTLRENNPQ